MSARIWPVALMACCGALGCSATRGTPFENLAGQQFYLCCTMAFNPRLEASDSNYGQYRQGQHVFGNGPMLAAGTQVTIVKVGSSGIAFHPEGDETTYTLAFGYGKKTMTPSLYFHKILLDHDPMDAVKNAPAAIVESIKQGRLLIGMTREEALMARGYPPAHQTPDLASNQWTYYETPGFVDRVVFADGTIASIARGPAPE